MYCDKLLVKNGTGTMSKHLKNKHAEIMKSSPSTGVISQHLKNNLTGNIKHSTNALEKVVKHSSWIWKHATLVKVKGQPDRYKCTYCEKMFVKNGTGTISKHLKNKHSDEMKNSPSRPTVVYSRRLKSNQTEKMTNSPSSLEKIEKHSHSSWIWKHAILIQIKGQPDRYQCMYCEKTFVRNGTGTISRHLKNKHPEKMNNTQCTLTYNTAPTTSGKLIPPFEVRYLVTFKM
jgi:hypothetical protein